MEMRLDKRIQELHNQVGGEFSPFKLARYMGIKITFNELDKVFGYYEPIDDKHFYINSNIDLEKQEDVCFHLVTHYANTPDKELWITNDNFKVMLHNERIMTKLKNLVLNSKMVKHLQEITKLPKRKSSLM
jgi:hypothetical protein